MRRPTPTPHRVLIVGGGFGGLYAAKALRRAPVEVTLVDRANHHLFQPLLYLVAAGILAESEIAPPLRGILRNQDNARVLLAEVTGFDLDRREAHALSPDGDPLTPAYDSLMLAAGASHSYFGRDEWAPVAPGLKTLADAREVRSRILRAFELAELADDPAERAAWLRFAVIGGTSAPRPHSAQGRRGRRPRRRRHRRGRRAVRVPCRTVLWAAGVAPLPLARALGHAGRVIVREDLTLPDRDEVFAIGDIAALDGVPGVAPAAMQQGRRAARTTAPSG